ncbi:glycosyltransferase [Bacillus sp. WC2507]|uniref:glycosyltransferase n=1 Tax=Bacillus sp. WC2507 TaxID=3461404 RepID=UPI0040410FD6
MKSLVFVHDHKVKKINNNYYSSGGLGQNVLNRYLKYFDTITLLVRCEVIHDENMIDRLKLVNSDKIQVVEIPDYNKISNLGMINKIVEKEVAKSSYLISRLPSILGSIAIKSSEKLKIPYAIEMVACPWDGLWNYGNLKGKIMAPLMFLYTKKLVRNSKNVIYVTKTFLQNRYPNSGHNIGCSDVEIFDASEETLDYRLNKNLKEQRSIKVGLIGGLNTKYKGHEFAFKAIKTLSNDYNIELHLLGNGDVSTRSSQVQEMGIERNIIFDGTRENGEEVWKWLDNMDIYIQPSLQEGLPRATVEAMSRGCAVIASDCGGLVELIDPEFLIKKGDYGDLANKLKKLIEEPELYKLQSKRNFIKSKEFTAENLNKLRDRFYSNLL